MKQAVPTFRQFDDIATRYLLLLAGFGSIACKAPFMVQALPVWQGQLRTIIMGGYFTDGIDSAEAGETVSQLYGQERVPVDTNLSGGRSPQSIAASTAQIAMLGAIMAGNASTATSGAVTTNLFQGLVTTESLTTAVDATYTLTITNSTVAATSDVQAAMYHKAGTTGGPMVLTSVTPASGSVVLVFTNKGSAALNGTMFVAFMVTPAA